MGRLKPAHTHEHVDERHVSILGQRALGGVGHPASIASDPIDSSVPHRCPVSLKTVIDDR